MYQLDNIRTGIEVVALAIELLAVAIIVAAIGHGTTRGQPGY